MFVFSAVCFVFAILKLSVCLYLTFSININHLLDGNILPAIKALYYNVLIQSNQLSTTFSYQDFDGASSVHHHYVSYG